MIGRYLTGLLLILSSIAAWADEGAFETGASAYATGKFDQAAAAFRDAAVKAPSFGAWYNLGNSEWVCDHPGEAVLAWERALWIDPYNRNAKSNLRFARRMAQLPSPDVTWWEACSMWLPVNSWAWISSVSIWVSVGLVVLPGVFRRQKTGWHQGVASTAFAIFLISLPAIAGVHSRSKLAVILSKDTPLRQTPTREAQTVVPLPAGEMVRCQGSRGDYIFIRASGDAAGWVEKSAIGLIAKSVDKIQ
jgi:tetratricopeptide (TPR) repeat protein